MTGVYERSQRICKLKGDGELARYRNTFHIGHIAAQFLTNLLDSVAANSFVHVAQLSVIYRAFGNRFAQVAGLQGSHELFQQRYASVREQVVTVFCGIGDNHVHFVQALTGDGVGDQRQLVQRFIVS